jgi:dihydrofolate synthase/folylpolyglutamate synthase
LGSTREQIAFEKAGIIKPNIPVVVGPNAELPIIFEEAKKQNSKMHLINQKTFDTFDEENIAISRLFLINLEPQLMF